MATTNKFRPDEGSIWRMVCIEEDVSKDGHGLTGSGEASAALALSRSSSYTPRKLRGTFQVRSLGPTPLQDDPADIWNSGSF